MDSSYKIPPAEPQILRVGMGAEARDISYIAQPSGPQGVPGLFLAVRFHVGHGFDESDGHCRMGCGTRSFIDAV